MTSTRAEVAHLLVEGRTPSEIAQALGLARTTVYYHVQRLREEAATDPQAVEHVPIPVRARWSVETRARVQHLFAEGLSRAEIAQAVGVSRPTVSYHAR